MIVYKLIDNTNDNYYIGSTINFEKRKITHNTHKNYERWASHSIIKNDDYRFEILEQDENNNHKHKIMREQYYLDKYINDKNCLNVINSYSRLTKKEYNKQHSLKRNRWIRSWGDERYTCSLWKIKMDIFD